MAQAQQAAQFSREQPKKVGKNKFVHTADTQYGMGDYVGRGIKAKVGRMRDGVGVNQPSKKGLNTPPRSLA